MSFYGPLFWTSGDVSSGVHSLRLTSGVTLAGQRGDQSLFPKCMFQLRKDTGFKWQTSCIRV